jgi:hypothetical protein
MALFRAAELLEDKPKLQTVVLGHTVENGKELSVTVTIEVTDKLREAYRNADAKYRFAPRYRFQKGSQVPIGELVNDPVQFCKELLQIGYKDSENLIDKPSKQAVLALLNKEYRFAKTLASKLVDVFERDDLFQDEEDAEKN